MTIERVPAYTAAAVRAAEAPLLEAGAPLMREAASALADVARAELAERPGPVLVLAGAGDNGGDALFAGAELAATGAAVQLLLTSDRVHREALSAALAAGAALRNAADVRERPDGWALVLDGILGIGAESDSRLRGVARAVVESLLAVIVASDTAVIAVDLPSGLHPDDGSADTAVLPARITVTFGAVKAGLVRGRGPELAGEIRLIDLGLEPLLARARPALTAPIPIARVLRRQRA